MMRTLTNALVMFVIGFILVFAHTLVSASFASMVLPHLSEGHATLNVLLLRGSSVFAAFLVALLIAFPTGFLLGSRLHLWGGALAVAGWLPIVVYDPKEALSLIPRMYLELLALLVCSGLLYYWGLRIRQRRESPNQPVEAAADPPSS
jgi:hypothetical protein